jgi:hypothetical protein
MRFSAIIASIALFASIVVATPVERSAALEAVPGVGHPANIIHAAGAVHPTANAHADVAGGETGGLVSKRSDYNELEGRSTIYLLLCTASNCAGYCYEYSLYIPAETCYETIGLEFKSVYAYSSTGAGYGFGAFVGSDCYGQ